MRTQNDSTAVKLLAGPPYRLGRERERLASPARLAD
jgi:hypothetical protein